eukprot:SAG11_NODE_604_length_8248_cov_6.574251_5_plen_442_part_00
MDAHRLDVITATRRQSETPFHTRHNLARLLYDKTFARAFERTCTLVQLHHLYTACKRLQHHRQAARRGRIVTICRRKFGLHPGLAMTIKIRTPLRATRRQLLDSARAAVKAHSDLPPQVNTIICRNLRIVFSRSRRVIDYFDNVRQHCAGYIAGTVRECTCKNLTQFWRHPSTGCVALTSSDYNGAFADVLHQNCRTVCFPRSDTTIKELRGAVNELLKKLNRRTSTPSVTCAMPWTSTNQTDTPHNADSARVQTLARLLVRDQQLVCGLCDHARGALFFTCPRHFDSLLPQTFPIDDADRFKLETRTEEDILQAVLIPMAERFSHLSPLRRTTGRRPHQIGIFYALMKQYPSHSPKFMSKLRPISNYCGDPLTPILTLLGRALMWLIRATVESGVLPWIMTRTEDLVPFLRERMLAAVEQFSDVDDIRWSIRIADAEGFY